RSGKAHRGRIHDAGAAVRRHARAAPLPRVRARALCRTERPVAPPTSGAGVRAGAQCRRKNWQVKPTMRWCMPIASPSGTAFRRRRPAMRTIHLLALLMTAVLANPVGTGAAQDLRVYGPGGPEPAIREAASQFGTAHGIAIAVTAGPTGKWIAAAKADADL